MVFITHPAHVPVSRECPSAPRSTTGTWQAPRTSVAIPIPLIFFALALASMTSIDPWIARLCLNERLPNSVKQIFEHIETFGHGVGIVVTLLTVWFVDPARRRMLPRLAAASFGSGLAANVVKLVVARTRPYHWLEQTTGAVSDQFAGWFPLGMGGSHLQSFPSAHAATAVGMALGLGALYPQGARFFATIAALVGVQRVIVEAHFVSDVLAGTALAWLVVPGLLRVPAVARRFDLWERQTAANNHATAPQGRESPLLSGTDS